MEVWNEPAVLFEKSTMFTKSRFCKIYKVTSENPSGYLPHSHDYMQIWYITRGCCEHWVEGQKHLMARGDIFIVPPKVEHQVVRLEDAEIISCEFSFDHFFPPKENSAYQQVHEAALNLSFAWLFLKDADDIHSQFSLRPETGERVNTLMNAMLVEYENGNYCVAGGDFNKDLLGNSAEIFGVAGGENDTWAQPIPEGTIPAGLSLVAPFDPEHPVATCRTANEPYDVTTSFRVTVDGFLVSDNVEVLGADVVDADYRYSDHNPIYMDFILKSE